jgi:ABC-type protease/lipase transport system fused ATPase/permease subunit
MKSFIGELPPALVDAMRACRRHLAIAAVFSALINILYLAPTIYMMQVYDRVVPTGGVVTLLWITAVVAFAISTLAALEAVRARLMVRASLRLDRLLSGSILDRLLAEAGNNKRSGQALRDFDAVRQAFGGPAMTALFDAPWTPLYFLVAFFIHPVLGGLILLGGILLVAVAWANERWTQGPTQAAHRALSASYGLQEAILNRHEVVRALGMRRALVARQLQERRAGMSLIADAQFAGARFTSLAKFLRLFLQSLALGVAAWLAVNRQISVGAIIAASVLLSRSLQPIELLIGSWKQVLQARDAVKSLSALFAADRIENVTPLPIPGGNLDLERVIVRGPGESPILKGVSFALERGEMLGIIGPSGAGEDHAGADHSRRIGARCRHHPDRRRQLLRLGCGAVGQTYRLSSPGPVAVGRDHFPEYLALFPAGE